MTRLTDAELAAAIAECERRSLPWKQNDLMVVASPLVGMYGGQPVAHCGGNGPVNQCLERAAFIVESANTRLSLLQELAELRAENARLKGDSSRLIRCRYCDTFGLKSPCDKCDQTTAAQRQET